MMYEPSMLRKHGAVLFVLFYFAHMNEMYHTMLTGSHS